MRLRVVVQRVAWLPPAGGRPLDRPSSSYDRLRRHALAVGARFPGPRRGPVHHQHHRSRHDRRQRRRAWPSRVTPASQLVPGIEISAVADGRDVHVLGYFIDTASPSLRAFLDRQREDRVRRVAEMGDRLAALGCPIDVAPILADAALRAECRPPADCRRARWTPGTCGPATRRSHRFLEFGGAAYVPRCGASPEEVVAIIHEAGGIASLAHPGVDGARSPDRPARRRRARRDRGRALGPRRRRPRRATAPSRRDLGLLVTAGSDFHGDWRTPRLAARGGLAPAGGVRGTGRRRSARAVARQFAARGFHRVQQIADVLQKLLASCPPVRTHSPCSVQKPNRRFRGALRLPVAASRASRRVAAAVEKASSCEMISVARDRAAATRATISPNGFPFPGGEPRRRMFEDQERRIRARSPGRGARGSGWPDPARRSAARAIAPRYRRREPAASPAPRRPAAPVRCRA